MTLCLIQIPTILHEIFHLEWFSHLHHFGALYVLFISQFLNLWTLMNLCLEDPGFMQRIVLLSPRRNTDMKLTRSSPKFPKMKTLTTISRHPLCWWEDSKLKGWNFVPLAISTDLWGLVTVGSVGYACKGWIIIVLGLGHALAKKTTSTFIYSYYLY